MFYVLFRFMMGSTLGAIGAMLYASIVANAPMFFVAGLTAVVSFVFAIAFLHKAVKQEQAAAYLDILTFEDEEDDEVL